MQFLLLAAVSVMTIDGVSSLMCYICGQDNLSRDRDCPGQFKGDCSPYAENVANGSRILCRTTRHKAGNGAYNVLKECVSDADHLLTFPGGKTDGCEDLGDNNGHEISYCVCSSNLCNVKPIQNQTETFSRPNEVIVSLPNQPISDAVRPVANRSKGFTCMVCGEGNVEGTNPDCGQQQQMDCTKQYPPSAKTFCFTRDSVLNNGLHAIEKFCLSENALVQEYGEDALQNEGCATAWQGRVRYCICFSPNCNAHPIAHWWNGTTEHGAEKQSESPHGLTETFTTAAPLPKMESRKCLSCGESDLLYPTDCAEMYEYDCQLQYPTGTDVLCLTRQTKLPTGFYAVEKRCIAAEEHREQYPGAAVVMNGCGDAWRGYVQYCVCNTDYCNHRNLTLQQQHNGITAAITSQDLPGVAERGGYTKHPMPYSPYTTVPNVGTDRKRIETTSSGDSRNQMDAYSMDPLHVTTIADQNMQSSKSDKHAKTWLKTTLAAQRPQKVGNGAQATMMPDCVYFYFFTWVVFKVLESFSVWNFYGGRTV